MNEVLTRFINRLTDFYAKNPESGVNKLMQIATAKIQENEDTLNKVAEWRDIDKAEGSTLDLYGSNVKQYRGLANDEVYRVLIISKIKRNLSNGSINTLIDFLSFILQEPKSAIVVKELWASGQPAQIKIDVPSGSINKTGLSRNQFGTLVNEVVAAGIKAHVLFEGTFAFSSVYEASETSGLGFADDALTTGGTLGDSYDPANDFELPI